MTQMLKKMGYKRITVAENGRKVLEQFDAHPNQFDVILMDINMVCEYVVAWCVCVMRDLFFSSVLFSFFLTRSRDLWVSHLCPRMCLSSLSIG